MPGAQPLMPWVASGVLLGALWPSGERCAGIYWVERGLHGGADYLVGSVSVGHPRQQRPAGERRIG